MKVMMYAMPLLFLSFLNQNSAGLSYYYFLANMITFGQTALMRRFIDEDALHRKIQENKKKPAKKSRFQERLEQMQKERMKQVKKK
jgi:YidC/Oxa1 family membrane protein insertase